MNVFKAMCIAIVMFVHLCVPAYCHDQGPLSPDAAFERAFSFLVRGDKASIVDKRVGPVRLLATFEEDSHRDFVVETIAEINDAFGYGKIALSEKNEVRLEDDAIILYIGPKRLGRQFVQKFGVSSPRAFRGGVYYYWWDKAKRNVIRRALIALDLDETGTSKSKNLGYLILGSLGYPGVRAFQQQNQPRHKSAENSEEKMLSRSDAAVIRFCDKHVPPGVRSLQIRKIFEREWPDFSAAYWNPSADDESSKNVGLR